MNQTMRCAGLLLAAGLVGCGGSVELPTGTVDPADLVATISTGEEVDLQAHTAAGRWTLFEFTADF